MRIGCLQFAPRVGDIDNNLNRADSILNKANPDDLDSLDLLVLPELAFTGYNFRSLQEICPYLEPSGSGISSLWARTTALKYNTTVIVGYPEKVDVTPRWPTSPEYYNSAIVVNGNGETVANYRKSFLYSIDETWALEGKDGFFHGDIPGFGSTAIGICMDLNPYKFEAPWHAFEFGFHIMEVQANLVIVTMAWLTREDARHFSRMPAEPDMDTLTYWVQRLGPVIRAEGDQEVIVIFCNRTGTEGDAVYAGTSTVLGIKEGEVSVYGLLGRGVKDLLVVDTNTLPFAKLVHRPEETEEAHSRGEARKPAKSPPAKPKQPSPSKNMPQLPKANAPGRPTPTPDPNGRSRRQRPPSPRIQIPKQTRQTHRKQQPTDQGTPIDESPTIPTPTAPSPTPLSKRPNIVIPGSRPTTEHINTPYPRAEPTSDAVRIYGGHVTIDQPTPTPSTASPSSGQISEKYFWMPPQTMLQSPGLADLLPHPASPIVASSLVKLPRSQRNSFQAANIGRRASSPESDRSAESVSNRSDGSNHDEMKAFREIVSGAQRNENAPQNAPPRPSSPKSRNTSRTGRPLERRNSAMENTHIPEMTERLEALRRQTRSAVDPSQDGVEEEHRQGRPRLPKSRNASRVEDSAGAPQIFDGRVSNIPRTDIPVVASPSGFNRGLQRPQSDMFSWAGSTTTQRPAEPTVVRPSSRVDSRVVNHIQSSPKSMSRTGPQRPDSRCQSMGEAAKPQPHIEPDESRTLVWTELSKLVNEVFDRPSSRSMSRGRSRLANRSTSAGAPPPITRTPRSGSNDVHSVPRQPSRFASRDRHAVIQSEAARQTGSHGVPSGPQAPVNPIDPDDEIVAEIIFHNHGCPTHRPGNQEQTGNSTQNQPNSPTNPSAAQRDASRQSRGQNYSQVGHRNDTPRNKAAQRQDSSPFCSDKRRRDSNAPSSDRLYKAPTPPPRMPSYLDSNDLLPTMDGASIHTIASPNGSPTTPPPRIFEPTTPKAMKLDPDLGTIISSASDPTSSDSFPPLDALERDALGNTLNRPRTAIW